MDRLAQVASSMDDTELLWVAITRIVEVPTMGIEISKIGVLYLSGLTR